VDARTLVRLNAGDQVSVLGASNNRQATGLEFSMVWVSPPS